MNKKYPTMTVTAINAGTGDVKTFATAYDVTTMYDGYKVSFNGPDDDPRIFLLDVGYSLAIVFNK